MARDGVLRHVISGGQSTVSIAETVKAGGILLVRIPEWEVSASAAAFLGSFVQERVRLAAYGRWSSIVNKGEALPFFLYVDEFQTFATSGFEEIVAEARKFGLGLILANQNLGQLSSFSRFTGTSSSLLREAVLGNVANLVVLGVGSRDAEVLGAELGVEADSVRRIGVYSALVKARVRGEETPTFTLDIPAAETDRGLPAVRDAVRRLMVENGIWRSRKEIAAEAAARETEMAERTRPFQPLSTPRIPRSTFVEGWGRKLDSLEPRPRQAQAWRPLTETEERPSARTTAKRSRATKTR